MWLAISTILSKLKDFSDSQAVMYTTYAVLSQKWCKIATLLLETTNGSVG